MPVEAVTRINAASSCTLAFNMFGQRAQTAEDVLIVRMVRTQLHAIALGNGQGDFQGVDRIQAEVAAKQRCFGIDLGGGHRFEIECFHDQGGQFVFGGGLRGHACSVLRMPGQPLGGRVAGQCNIGVFRSRLLLPSMIQASEILQVHADLPRTPSVTYRTTSPAMALAEAGTLAAFGFGAGAPDVDDIRWLRVPLECFDAPAPLEVWQVDAEVVFGRQDNVRWSAGGGWLFAAIELDERTTGGVESAAHQAYAELRRFMSTRNERYVLRIWNYIADINLGDGDGERYKQFCDGRAAGLGDFFTEGYPAATAIGHHHRDPVLQIYLLACVEDGVAVENPRQTSAWRYPREYGRTSPGFARGMLLPARDALAISGTAAVVGHASAHEGDLEAQLEETLLNLEALLATADMPAGFDTHSPLKGYVRHATDAAHVRELLQRRLPGVPVLLMHGDVCRRELLVELDGWRFK